MKRGSRRLVCNPKPETLNLQPATRNLKPETLPNRRWIGAQITLDQS